MKFTLNKYLEEKVHFIGIGGVSMSGLAAILLNNNIQVSGSDSKKSETTEKLKTLGASIYVGHSRGYLNNVSLVVYTAAIPQDNPELLEAQEKNIKAIDRAEFLGFLMKDYTKNIAVAGTHGKTTTTSMLTNITLSAKLDPTILVGGDVEAINGNFRIGNSEYFITESCEYKASFLKFNPFVGIILNIDEDHLDFYRDINHIEYTFLKFANIIPATGCLVACADDVRTSKLAKKISHCKVITYGVENGDVQAKNIHYDKTGCAKFIVSISGTKEFEIKLSSPGKHNILNALAAISSSVFLNIPIEHIQRGLLECKGAHKRFEYKGSYNDATIIDDYAHHPNEIKATLDTAKLIPHNRTYVVFQPHTYTRTKALFNDFVNCFEHSDELILLDIYAAREKDTGLVSSVQLGDSIRKTGLKCINVSSHADAFKYLQSKIKKDDMLLTIGAGDVVNVANMLINELSNKSNILL